MTCASDSCFVYRIFYYVSEFIKKLRCSVHVQGEKLQCEGSKICVYKNGSTVSSQICRALDFYDIPMLPMLNVFIL